MMTKKKKTELLLNLTTVEILFPIGELPTPPEWEIAYEIYSKIQ